MSHSTTPNTQDQYGGVVVVGLADSGQLAELIASVPAQDVGYIPPLYLVEQDIDVARRAVMSLGIANDSRFHGAFGPNAGRELATHFATHLDEINVPNRLVSCGQHDRDLREWIQKELERLRKQQRHRSASWRSAIEARASIRDGRYWNDRFEAIRGGDPARILIVTTRFSTYMQHANRDLAHSLEQLGHEVRVLTEPSTHTMLAPHITLRAQHDFDPDIVITTNYPRAMYDKSYPPGAVNVCWVQDAMAHLFDPMPGSVAELDFIAGFLYEHAPALDAYGADRRLPSPMPVSERKFNPEPVEHALREQYTCDIAYISHQSAPPEDLHRENLRLWPEQHHPLIEEVRRYVYEIADSWDNSYPSAHQAGFEHEFEDALGPDTPPQALAMLWHQYAHPMLERILRHRMLGWASEIAEEHHLDFRLYGRGWDTHPTLAKFAHGEIEHGEALRASYQCTRVQLHASSLGVGHQRQYECAMSGGQMLSLRFWPEFLRENWLSVLEYVHQGSTPDAMLVHERLPCHSIRNHPTLRSLLRERDKLPTPPLGWDHTRYEDVFAKLPADPKDPEWEEQRSSMADRPLRLLSDPFDLTFSTKAELETKILRCCEDPQWRSARASSTRSLVFDRVAMSRFAESLISLITDRLCQPQQLPAEEVLA
ncbi:MAG: CgeB family protein [Phycisphaerales bacterium]